MLKNKILILGPIGDFGGREVEVNIIASALEHDYEVSILSTGYMTNESFALINLTATKWFSIPNILFKKNSILRLLSNLAKIVNKGKLSTYAYLNNSVSKKVVDLDKRYLNEIYKKIEEVDLVLLCVQLTSKFLPEIVLFCEQKKIPCLVRTTGTIKSFSSNDFDFLKKVTRFIHHSEANAANLNKCLNLPYVVIDQCALNEQMLLAVSSTFSAKLRFGYIGRLSEEKGILPIAHFFATTNLPFVIAGDGDQKDELLGIIKESPNCEYIGKLANENLITFYDQVDAVIIPSREESGPLVALEAMAAGKIIISTKVGAMEERLEGLHSFWFQIENIATLKAALEQVLSLNESERVLLSNSLKERYLCKYSLQAVSERYKKITRQFIN